MAAKKKRKKGPAHSAEPRKEQRPESREPEPPPALPEASDGWADRALMLLLLVGGVVLAGLSLAPWATAEDGSAANLWSVLGGELGWATADGLQSLGLARFALAWTVAGGALVAALALAQMKRVRTLVAPLAAAVALVPLYILFAANPALLPSPHAPYWQSFLSVPVALGALVAAAGLHTMRRSPGTTAGRVAAGCGAVFVILASVMPFYAEGAWHWPVLHALSRLGGGSPSELGAGLVVILLLAGGGAALALLKRPRPQDLATRKPMWMAAEVGLLAAYPVWVLLVGAERGMIPYLPLAVVVAVLSTWLVLGTHRLLLRADERGEEAGFAAPGWRWLPVRGPLALEIVAVAVVYVLWFLLKTHGMGASNTDENIYFYMADLMTRGELPYKDFFFAHPPLHLAVPAALFGIFGFSITLAKLISVVAAGVTGAFVLAIGRRHIGRLAGVAGLIAFLFGNEVLKASTNLTGINLTTMWLAAGLWAAMSERFRSAGVFLGLAVCTGFYAIAGALAILAITAFRSRSALLRAGVAFVAVAGAINGACYVLGGSDFIDGVYLYHGKKPTRELLPNILQTVYFHPIPTFAFFLAPLAGVLTRWFGITGLPFLRSSEGAENVPNATVARADDEARRVDGAVRLLDPRTLWRGRPTDGVRIAWLVTLALGIEFMMFKELHSFYFTLWFPTLAVLTGFVVAFTGGALVHALRRVADGTGARQPILIALVAVIGLACWHPFGVSADASLRSFQAGRLARKEIRRDRTGVIQEYEQRGGVKKFDWRPSPVLPAFDGVVRALFWHEERTQASLQPGYAWYLQSKKRDFESAQRIADYIRENSAPNETITGASTIAPLIALLSERDMAALILDTNTKRFRAGTLTRQSFFERVCKDRLRFVIGAPNSFFSPRRPSNHPTVDEYFPKTTVFRDKHLLHWRDFLILLSERTTPTPEDGAPVCEYVPDRPR